MRRRPVPGDKVILNNLFDGRPAKVSMVGLKNLDVYHPDTNTVVRVPIRALVSVLESSVAEALAGMEKQTDTKITPEQAEDELDKIIKEMQN